MTSDVTHSKTKMRLEICNEHFFQLNLLAIERIGEREPEIRGVIKLSGLVLLT